MQKIILPRPMAFNPQATYKKEVFSTDQYHKGVAIQVFHHDGSIYNAVITDSALDYIEAVKVDIIGNPLKIEICLEDYLNGVWRIRKLR